MRKNKSSRKKTRKTAPEKKNLSIADLGDTVVIKNRSTVASGVLGVIMLAVFIVGIFLMRDLWSLPAFWIVSLALIAAVAWSNAKMLLGKIVLDSPNKLMIVYNPTKKQYDFGDINYVDLKTKKEKDGVVVHKVIVYIGNGKRSVEISSFSSKQADELVSLLRGMLDNGAIDFPEGNEEPFVLDEEKKEKKLFALPRLIKKNDTPAPPDNEVPVVEEDDSEKKASDNAEPPDEKQNDGDPEAKETETNE